ncbi:hypothetical protein niasHS_015878 [Heterodera schachtii]|uniref:Uncharacterized protein n=1 Tax=Heterodera schachtii TaxID=97005 RepID=A0ABD2HW03_HETSC
MYIRVLTILFIVHVVGVHGGGRNSGDLSRAEPVPDVPDKSKSKRTTYHFADLSIMEPVNVVPGKLKKQKSIRTTHRLSKEIMVEPKVASERTLIARFDYKQLGIVNDLLDELKQNLNQMNNQKFKWPVNMKKNDYNKKKKDLLSMLENKKDKESPCEEILPLSDTKGKEYKEKIKAILDKLTSWQELKRSFSNVFYDDAGNSTAGQSPFYSSTESCAGEVKEKEKKKRLLHTMFLSLFKNNKKKAPNMENHFQDFVKRHEGLVPAQHLDKARRSLDLFSPKSSPSGSTVSRTQSESTPNTSSSTGKKLGRLFRSSSVSVSTTQKTSDQKQEQKDGLKGPVLQRLPTIRGDGIRNSSHVRSKSFSVSKEASGSKLGTEQSVGSSGPTLKRATSTRRDNSMAKEESKIKFTKNPQKGQRRNSEPTERKRVSFELTNDPKDGLSEDDLKKSNEPKQALTLPRAMSTREVGSGHKKANEGRRSFDKTNSLNEKVSKFQRSSSLRPGSSMSQSFQKCTYFSPIEEERNVEEVSFELPFAKSSDRKKKIIDENAEPLHPPNPLEIGIIGSSANNSLSEGHRRSFELPKANVPKLSQLRSSSARWEPNMSKRTNKSNLSLYANSIEEEGVFQDGTLCKANWGLIEGRLNYLKDGEDKQLKHDLFDHFRRANYFLQSIILQSTLYRQQENGKGTESLKVKILDKKGIFRLKQ